MDPQRLDQGKVGRSIPAVADRRGWRDLTRPLAGPERPPKRACIRERLPQGVRME
jgi:hypothetical protein